VTTRARWLPRRRARAARPESDDLLPAGYDMAWQRRMADARVGRHQLAEEYGGRGRSAHGAVVGYEE